MTRATKTKLLITYTTHDLLLTAYYLPLRTEEQLEKTFVLNFGKKGELKDEIKELKAEIGTISKDAAKQAAVAEKAAKAEAAATKASEGAERQVEEE